MRIRLHRPVALFCLFLFVCLAVPPVSAAGKGDSKQVAKPVVVEPNKAVVTKAAQPVTAKQAQNLQADSALTPTAPVATAARTGEMISWSVIASGGGTSVSTNFILSSTIGQTAAGFSSSTSFQLNAGFQQNFTAGGGCCVGTTGDVNCDGSVGLPDLSTLIDHLFITFTPLCCEGEGDVNADGSVGLPDLSNLIDNLFITFTPLPNCF